MFAKAVAAFLASFVLLPSTLLGTPQDPAEILANVREAYANLKTFTFNGSADGKFELDRVKYGVVIPLHLAQGEDADESLGMMFELPRVEKLDGPHQDATSPDLSMPDLSYFEFARIGHDVEYAKFVREDSVEGNGKSSPCYVLEVLKRADPVLSRHAAAPTAQTLWIDKSTFLVLRQTFQTAMSAHDTTPAFTIDWNVTFTSYVLNRPVPDWLAVRKTTVDEQNAKLRASMVGTEAPKFELKDLDGKSVSLEGTRGKLVLIDFWATWCGPCRTELPIIASVEKAWSGRGLVVVRVTNEPPEDVRFFIQKTGESVPTLVDGKTVSTQYRVGGIPTIALVDKSGKIIDYNIGFLNEAQLTSRLTAAGVN